MAASRIYKVTVEIGSSKTERLIKAISKAQAERFRMAGFVSSCVASQDDICKVYEDELIIPIQDARKEATVDEGK